MQKSDILFKKKKGFLHSEIMDYFNVALHTSHVKCNVIILQDGSLYTLVKKFPYHLQVSLSVGEVK